MSRNELNWVRMKQMKSKSHSTLCWTTKIGKSNVPCKKSWNYHGGVGVGWGNMAVWLMVLFKLVYLFIGSSRSTQSLIRISPKYVCFAYVLLLPTATSDDQGWILGISQPHDAEESESESEYILQMRNIKANNSGWSVTSDIDWAQRLM